MIHRHLPDVPPDHRAGNRSPMRGSRPRNMDTSESEQEAYRRHLREQMSGIEAYARRCIARACTLPSAPEGVDGMRRTLKAYGVDTILLDWATNAAMRHLKRVRG